jgi:hypothetical protein
MKNYKKFNENNINIELDNQLKKMGLNSFKNN